MLKPDEFRGVFVIATTPFDEDGSVDFDGLDATIDFCIEAGVAGIVANANASEVAYLSDVERHLVARRIGDRIAGRCAYIVGCSSSCLELSADHARQADSVGADAIMAMPPNFHRPSAAEIQRYYADLSKVTDLPLVLQHFAGHGGTVMSSSLISQIITDCANVIFLKEETEYSSVLITECIELAGKNLLGTMGGKAGKAMIDEFHRGASGTMPACEVADIHVSIWNSLEGGDEVTARENFRLLLPLISFEMGYGPALYKEVLRRRGVIGSARFRQTGGRLLDEAAARELDTILEDLTPLMIEHFRPCVS